MTSPSITLGAGLGLKPEHFEPAIAVSAPGTWFEVHAENYMVDGGPRLRALDAVRAAHPLSLHGVSLSLAGDEPPDHLHLLRLQQLVGRCQPVLVSEHLAWSRWRGQCIPDLLPVCRTRSRLQRLAENVTITQEALGRRIAVENPAHYIPFEGHDWSEPDFLAELCRRTGCGLLLDLNNVQVSASNLGFDATACLDHFDGGQVMEIHLAGHAPDADASTGLCIDSHDRPVADAVWALHARFVDRWGPRPTLIERDDRLPAFAELWAERMRAQAALHRVAEPA